MGDSNGAPCFETCVPGISAHLRSRWSAAADTFALTREREGGVAGGVESCSAGVAWSVGWLLTLARAAIAVQSHKTGIADLAGVFGVVGRDSVDVSGELTS